MNTPYFSTPISITPNITPCLQDATAISEAEVAKFVEEQRAFDRERERAKLELEIELLKARLDECHRTIAELIRTKPSST